MSRGDLEQRTATVDRRRLWIAAVAGAATMFLVQPPADLWWAAWLAPLPWLAIVRWPRLAAHPTRSAIRKIGR